MVNHEIFHYVTIKAKLIGQKIFFKVNGDVTKYVSSFDLDAASKFQEKLSFMENRQI